MTAPTVPDQEFIELWQTHGSATEIARILGVARSRVFDRRRGIETKYHIKLEAHNPRGKHYAKFQTGVDYPHRYDMGIENGTVIVFSDAHFWPGLRTTAYKGLLLCISEMQPKAVVNNGDAFDGASISRWPRIGWDSTPTIIEELKACNIALGEIEETAKNSYAKVQLPWCLGNHDSRFENRLSANAPQYEQVHGFSLKDHFPAWKPCWSVWNTENTVMKHRLSGGIHATRNNALKAGTNIVTGHLHQLKVTPFNDYRGTRYGVDTGTLAEPGGPQFENYTEQGPSDWRSGFIVLTFYKGQLLWPEVVKVWGKDVIEFRGALIDVSKK
jgi:hypothetical protein